ncbi:hypothetical protein [Glaciihabitans sp. dw_435]|uniref:hypothetical protein n=1 Tax=Glaciihabitans sp. dw_435 TaxID=2720081 RepID=UPI001BD43F3F|nr:hypothetical protein [Glaciihabitans sp. dw_435]
MDPTVEAGTIQGWFTLAAAVVAALAAIVGVIVTGASAAKTQSWVGRDQWWQRFSWATEKAISNDDADSELGLSVLLSLINVPWAKREDNEMAITVARVVKVRRENLDRTAIAPLAADRPHELALQLEAKALSNLGLTS